jgi:hypothetical protein
MFHVAKAFSRFATVCVVLAFALATPQPDLQYARASTPDAARAAGCAGQKTSAAPGRIPSKVNFTGTGIISGYVTVPETGLGVPGVTIGLYGCYLLYWVPPNYQSRIETTSRWDGYYEFRGLDAGVYGLEIVAYGSVTAPLDYYPVDPTGRRVVVSEASTQVVHFAFARGGSVTGRVTNAQGVPIQDVSAELHSAAPPANTSPSQNAQKSPTSPSASPYPWVTDANGRYTLSGVRPGIYRVVFYPGFDGVPTSYAITTSALFTVTAPYTMSNVNAVLNAGGAITGRVIAADTGHSPQGTTLIYVDGVNVDYSGYTWINWHIGPDGIYQFTSLIPGTYRIHAVDVYPGRYLPQYYNNKTSLATANIVTVTAGVTTTNINFALDPGAQVSGTVTDQWGFPQHHVGAQVLNLQGTVVASTTTDMYGGYITNPGLPSGTYRVRFGTGVSPWFCDFPLYATQYYSGSSTFASATPLVLTAGTVRGNVNAVIAALSPMLYMPLVLR